MQNENVSYVLHLLSILKVWRRISKSRIFVLILLVVSFSYAFLQLLGEWIDPGKKMKNSVLFGLKITDLKKSLNLFLVVVIALTGDSIVNNYTFPFWPLLLKCLTDSSTHFLIAAFSWNYVVISAVNNKSQLAASFLCGLFASSIDVDHFISSGSISLQVKLNYMLNYWYIVTNFKLGLNISISKTNFTLYNYFNNFGSSSGYAFHKKAVH